MQKDKVKIGSSGNQMLMSWCIQERERVRGNINIYVYVCKYICIQM